jgi:phage tail protein X
MRRVYAQQGDTVDALCYRETGRTQDIVEATFEANPGLADYGPVLPIGTAVDLPDLADTPATNQLINLFD